MSAVRRLDHIGIVVRDTEEALQYFAGRLGLRVHHTEDLATPPVRLTYLDAGNAWLQLLEPLVPSSGIARHLQEAGEGVHHVCFGVDTVVEAAAAFGGDAGSGPPALGSGRGRRSAFAPGRVHGVQIECTEFRYDQDVEESPGWIA